MKKLISVREADQLITDHSPIYPAESCSILDAVGRILREDIHADRDLPPFNRVMMDGIAIASGAAANKRTFKVEAMIQAGDAPGELESPSDSCVEIMTGAVLPDNCDCVIPYEEVDITEDTATLKPEAKPSHMLYIHEQGSDQKQGDVLLKAGIRLFSPQIAVIASTGKSEILVGAGPKVAFVSTGNELVELGKDLAPHQIRPINNYGVTAALRHIGIDDVETFHLEDDANDMRTKLSNILPAFDMIILSGGVSMGKYDLVPAVLKDLGVTTVFHKIKERPGKPLWFGNTIDKKPVYGLPGNPVSTMMCFHRYVLPHIERGMGLKHADSEFATLAEDILFAFPLTYFPPARLERSAEGTLFATPVRYNNSGHFTAIGNSDGFLELPAELDKFPAGSVVRTHRWRY